MNKIIIIFAMLLATLTVSAQDWQILPSKGAVYSGFTPAGNGDITFMIDKLGNISLGIYGCKSDCKNRLVVFRNADGDKVIASFERDFVTDKGTIWYEPVFDEVAKKVVEENGIAYVNDPVDFFVKMFSTMEYIEVRIPETKNGDPVLHAILYNDPEDFYYTAKQMFK
jgi:hypothetical protein